VGFTAGFLLNHIIRPVCRKNLQVFSGLKFETQGVGVMRGRAGDCGKLLI
jgi:hypothetical protein